MKATSSNGFAPPENPFYLTNNKLYGTSWGSTGGEHPLKIENTPSYNQIVSVSRSTNHFRVSVSLNSRTQRGPITICCSMS